MSSKIPSAKYRDDATAASEAVFSSGAADAAVPLNNRVRVSVRVRPMISDESSTNRCVFVHAGSNVVLRDPRNPIERHNFIFDAAFDSTASQEQIFASEIEPHLRTVIDGVNTSVFCYGQTGAGKTYTMLGSQATDVKSLCSSQNRGIIPRTVEAVLQLVSQENERFQQRKNQQKKKRRLSQEDPATPDTDSMRELTIGETLADPSFELSCSYLEIYNEKVYDLLNFDKDKDLPIREDQARNISVQGLTAKPFSSMQEFAQIFAAGARGRSVAATKLNASSSRSHACLFITVKHRQPEPPYSWVTGKLHLIDLAGSEDNRKTGNIGQRMKESASINSSLFVLKKVVTDLNSGKSRIPYRDSKLTRLLQDSLGGRSCAIMIANIAPTNEHFDSTYNTLTFAMKSKTVVNTPVQNLSAFANDDEKKLFENLLGGAARAAAVLDTPARRPITAAIPGSTVYKASGPSVSGRSDFARPASQAPGSAASGSKSHSRSPSPAVARPQQITAPSSQHSKPVFQQQDSQDIQQAVLKVLDSGILQQKILQPLLEETAELKQRLADLERKDEDDQLIRNFKFAHSFEQQLNQDQSHRLSLGSDTPIFSSPSHSNSGASSSMLDTSTESAASSAASLSSATVSSLEFMSPGSKVKTARFVLQTGKQLLRARQYVQALYYLEQALVLLPSNENLREKVFKLRKKVASAKHQQVETPAAASMMVAPALSPPPVSRPQQLQPSALTTPQTRAPLQQIQNRPFQAAPNVISNPNFFVFEPEHVVDPLLRKPRPPVVQKTPTISSTPMTIPRVLPPPPSTQDKENQNPNFSILSSIMDSKPVQEPPRKKSKARFPGFACFGHGMPVSADTSLIESSAQIKSHNDMLLEFINHATLAELQELATIGSKRAEKIVEERPFSSLDELSRVGLLEKGLNAFIEKNANEIERLHATCCT